MSFWEVTFEGVFLGGTAVVAADSSSEAIDLVTAERRKRNLRGSEMPTAAKIPLTQPGILYFYDGDY